MDETFSIANGLHPVKEDGSINFDKKKTIEVLETYKALVEMSPGVFIIGKMVETFTQVMLFH